MMKRATARANANIALVKYWGKSDAALNIPAVPSLSMTLDEIGTTVTLSAAKDEVHELFIENQKCENTALGRLKSYLEQVRSMYEYEGFFCIKSTATVPYAAGLASSASFYAALAKALDHYLALDLDNGKLSTLARLGSASAARSIFGGIAGLPGGALTHEDARAFSLATPLNLAMVIAMVSQGQKKHSSREAMNHTKETSPFYRPFINSAHDDFDHAQRALERGSFVELGTTMEHSTLKMHASMWASMPSINYLLPATLELINLVCQLRKEHGPIAFFTIDAGPHVKILCENANAPFIADFLNKHFSAATIRLSLPGPGVQLTSDHIS